MTAVYAEWPLKLKLDVISILLVSLSQVRPRGRTIPAQWMNKPPITLNVPLVAFIQANGSSNWPDQSYLFHIQILDYSSALYPRQQEVLRPIKSCESCNRDLAGSVTMVRFSIYRSISLWAVSYTPQTFDDQTLDIALLNVCFKNCVL